MAIASIDQSSTNQSNIADWDQRYFAVPVAILVGLPELRCDVYIQHVMSSRKLLYRGAHSNLPIGDDEKLRRRKVTHFYLRVEDQSQYDQAVRDALAAPAVNPAMRLALTVQQHRDAFQVAIRHRSAVPVVAASEKIAEDVLRVIDHDALSVSTVLGLLDHDNCTFQHSCNVAIYSATLAKRVGLGDQELNLLTNGGLLHDIGKRQIPAFILRKPGKLDDREREIIRQHPTTGFRELTAIPHLSWGQLMMAYQHHEWFNGSGYPVGITGEEIHLWARICAVADVFDALTANRPYRESGHAQAALEIMNKEAGHFDQELIQLWGEMAIA